MKTQTTKSLLAALIGVVLTAELHAQPSAFSFQGRLTDNGSTASGVFDLRFAIFVSPTNGTPVSVVTNAATEVSDGLFTVTIDFAAGVFDGGDRWLEVGVRTNGGGAFAPLSPRQRITSTPYAIWAASASTVNTGTISDPMFIGTTTITPLELFVNNQRVMLFEDNGDSGDSDTIPDGAPNVIAGSPANIVGDAVVGATIAGGGASNWNESARMNVVLADYGSVLGGLGNMASGLSATAMGQFTEASGGASTAMGFDTEASGSGATAMGQFTEASGTAATAIGYSTVAGGSYSTAMGYSTVANGSYSTAMGRNASANHQGAFVWADSQFPTFASTGNNQFLIRASGFVGINTPNPSSDLTVSSSDSTITGLDLYNTTIPSGSGGWRHQVVGNGVAGRVGNFEIWYIGSGVNGLTIQPDGDVGLGTTSPSYRLHVNGSVAGIGSYNTLSDRRFKNDIRSLTNALETITRLQGVSFDWRHEEHPEMQFEAGRQLGFIAQDLRRVVPEAVSESKDGTLHAAYAQIIPLLVEAIKEQNQQMVSQKEENDELRQELQEIKRFITSNRGTAQ